MLKHPPADAGGSPGLRERDFDFGQVVQLVDTRRSERRARTGLGVRLSPWSLRERLTARFKQKAPSPRPSLGGPGEGGVTTQGGQCPVEPHKLQAPGATPGPATGSNEESPRTTTGYANRKSGGVESAVILWVRLPPRLLIERTAGDQREPAYKR
jgi:hypothetical protein